MLQRFAFRSQPERDQRQRPDLPIRIQILILLKLLESLHAGRVPAPIDLASVIPLIRQRLLNLRVAFGRRGCLARRSAGSGGPLFTVRFPFVAEEVVVVELRVFPSMIISSRQEQREKKRSENSGPQDFSLPN